MPPSGFNEKAIRGLLQFVEGCYEDLLIQVGSSSDAGEVQTAIQRELSDIRKALQDFTLDEGKKQPRKK